MMSVIKPFESLDTPKIKIFLGGTIGGGEFLGSYVESWRDAIIDIMQKESWDREYHRPEPPDLEKENKTYFNICFINPESSTWTERNIEWEEKAIEAADYGLFWFADPNAGERSLEEIDLFRYKDIACGENIVYPCSERQCKLQEIMRTRRNVYKELSAVDKSFKQQIQDAFVDNQGIIFGTLWSTLYQILVHLDYNDPRAFQ